MKNLVIIIMIFCTCAEASAQCDESHRVSSDQFEKFAITSLKQIINYPGPSALECDFAIRWNSPAQISFDLFGIRPLPDSARAILASANSMALLVPFDRNNEDHWARKKTTGTRITYTWVFHGSPVYIRYFPPGDLFEGSRKSEVMDLLMNHCPFYLPPINLRGWNITTRGFEHLIRIEGESGTLDVGLDFSRSSISFASGEKYLGGGHLMPETVKVWQKLIAQVSVEKTDN